MGGVSRDLTKEEPFGRLKVISRAWTGSNSPMWACECKCGRVTIVAQDKLLSGHTQSCGCIRQEVTAQRNRDTKTTHGRSKTNYYALWNTMIARCERPKHVSYPEYGGRGIRVCQRWRESFEAFAEDMGERPEGYEIDRKETDGHYEPSNCHWVPPKVNTRNRRVTPKYEHDGRSLSLGEWSEVSGVPYLTLKDRIRHGWTIERAINTPIRKKG